MLQSVDSLWKSVVKQLQQLQQLSAKGPEQQWDALSTIKRDIDALINRKSVPRAAWKQLIRDLKVCAGFWQPNHDMRVGMMHRKRYKGRGYAT